MEIDAEQDEYNGRTPPPISFSESVGWTHESSSKLLADLIAIRSDTFANRLAKRRKYKELLGDIIYCNALACQNGAFSIEIVTNKYVLLIVCDFSSNIQEVLNYDAWSKKWETHSRYIKNLTIKAIDPSPFDVSADQMMEMIRKLKLDKEPIQEQVSIREDGLMVKQFGGGEDLTFSG